MWREEHLAVGIADFEAIASVANCLTFPGGCCSREGKLRRLCFARIKTAFEMNSIQRWGVTL